MFLLLKQSFRYDKKEKKKIEIQRPAIVDQYNSKMGGIDLQDMLLNLYRIDRKSNKFYMRIVFYLIGTAVNNSWFEYRRSLAILQENSNETMCLKQFSLDICEGLSKAGKSFGRKPGRPSQAVTQPPPLKRRLPNECAPGLSVRHDQIDHLPTHATKGRCKHCTIGQTRWKCCKCGVHLCLHDKKNCFYDFHIRLWYFWQLLGFLDVQFILFWDTCFSVHAFMFMRLSSYCIQMDTVSRIYCGQ